MSKARRKMQLRHQMIRFLTKQGRPTRGGLGKKNADLKLMIAELFGVSLTIDSDNQIKQLIEQHNQQSRPNRIFEAATKRIARSSVPGPAFYDTDEWRRLRYLALKLHGGACQCCGHKPPKVVLHVDHVKPRSRYPHLELDIDNLQVLCEGCNLGKGAWDETDWRPSPKQRTLMRELREAERALAEDPSELNFNWLQDVRSHLEKSHQQDAAEAVSLAARMAGAGS